MESDFGLPDNDASDDFDQDYSSYSRVLLGVEVDVWDSDGSDDDDCVVAAAAPSKRRRGGRRRGKGVGAAAAAVSSQSHNTSFYDYVLCWQVDKINNAARLEHPGPPLASLRTEYTFAREEQYTSYMMATVLEEVRALLGQAVIAADKGHYSSSGGGSIGKKKRPDEAPFVATLVGYDDGRLNARQTVD